jgi:hypothetical protein
MNFDERARRASQGVHRAVEVMEMSSTKTPQKLTRFDQYRGRTSRNRRIVAIAVGVGLPLLLLIGAVRFLGSDPDPTVPLAPPSTSVSPTPVSGRTTLFEAPFTYTLPPGWTVSEGDRWWFRLRPDDAPLGWGDFYVFSSFVPARSDCSARPAQGVGRSSDAMTSWLSTHPALDATTPREVTLGRATGSWVDVQLADDWDYTCPGGPMGGLRLVTAYPDWHGKWSITPYAKLRFYVLDLPAGDTVTIVIEATDVTHFNDVIDQAAPLVESFKFLD